MVCGALKHMKGSYNVFETLAKWDSKLRMVVVENNEKEIKGSCVVPFNLDSR